MKGLNIIDQYKQNNMETQDFNEGNKAEVTLEEIADRLKVSDKTVDKTIELIYKHIEKAEEVKHDRTQLMIGTLFLTSYANGEARSKRQIQKEYNELIKGDRMMNSNGDRRKNRSKFSTRDIREASRRIQEVIDVKDAADLIGDRHFRKPSDFVDYWDSKIDLSAYQLNVLRTVSKELENTDTYCGYAPLPMTASILWLITGEEHSKESLAEKSVSTRTTIRSNSRELLEEGFSGESVELARLPDNAPIHEERNMRVEKDRCEA